MSKGDNGRITALAAVFTYFEDVSRYGKKDAERAENWLAMTLKKAEKSAE